MISVADMMSHLAVQINSPLGGYLEGKVRTAVLSAWGRLLSMHEWAYFHRMGTIISYASQSTGTVDFDVSARTVTLTGDTWPTDVTAKHIRLDYNWYPVYKRTSSTVIELFDGKHPDDDLDDAEFVLQQILYPLPSDVGDIVQIIDGTQNLNLMRLNLLEAHMVQDGFAWSPSLPTVYALVADSANPTRWNLWLPTIQTSNTVLQYLYVARKPSNVLDRETRGTVTVASGVATFSEAVVNDNWTGALLRVAKDDISHPTGEFGDVPGNDLLYQRNCHEVRVVEVLSTTTCQISDTSIAETSVAYCASSLIDVCDGAMAVLLQRLCEDEYGVRLVGNHSEMLVSKSRLAQAFNDAKASDGRYVRAKGISARWYGLRLQDVGYVGAGS
jgi:hypothetical protein